MKIERVKAIYDEISQFEITLEADPRSLGPLYLQNVISTCRNYLNSVSRFQLEAHREKQELTRSLRAAETAYEVAFSEILSNDERVRRLPSIEDRKATANTMLRDQLSDINTIKSQVLDLEYVEKAIRHRHKELTCTMGEIKLQRSLIRDEIDSGAMYGDERRSDHERGDGATPLGDDINEAELDALLNQEEPPEVSKTEEPAEAPTADSPPATDAAAVAAFLDGPDDSPPKAEENYDEVFARL